MLVLMEVLAGILATIFINLQLYRIDNLYHNLNRN